MRVLYFYQYFTTPDGSFSTRVYEFTRRWVKAGDQVTVLTSVYDKSGLTPVGWFPRMDIEGVDVRIVNIKLSNKHGYVMRALTFAAYAGIACWYALTRTADVVISSSGPLSVGVPGLVARYLRGRPFVFEVRDLWPEGAIQLKILRNPLMIRLARTLERACYRGASTVVALSPGMADWIRETYDIQHIAVVPNASDNEFVDSIDQPIELPEWAIGKHLVVYTGSIGLMYDCGQCVELAKVLQERGVEDVEVVLIGDGKERPMLEARASELGLRHCHFTGLMPKLAVMQWLMASCCSVCTVKDLPFLATFSPNKIFDAFAAGVPVVQVSQGWVKDLVAREDCGINVPLNDAEAMADAVLTLARDPETCARMGANSRRVGREQFDRGLLSARMRAVLLEASGTR